MRRVTPSLLSFVLLGSTVWADNAVPTDLGTRLRGSSRTIVGSVSRVESRVVVTPRGDRMIVSRTLVRVDEALKGRREPYLEVDIEGGTIGQLSMRVSDMEPLVVGERAVVLLEPTAGGGWKPHRRGLGLLRLGADNRIVGSELTLDQVRRLAAEVK